MTLIFSQAAISNHSLEGLNMKRETMNLAPVNVLPLEAKAAACTSSGAQQLIPAISSGLIFIFLL